MVLAVRPSTYTAVEPVNSVSCQFAAICDEAYACSKYPQTPSIFRPEGYSKSSAVRKKYSMSSPNQLHENAKYREL